MKRARITYEGAFHHDMNRGINGDAIFSESKSKAMFLDLMDDSCLSPFPSACPPFPLEAVAPQVAFTVMLFVVPAAERFLQLLHKPGNRPQPLTQCFTGLSPFLSVAPVFAIFSASLRNHWGSTRLPYRSSQEQDHTNLIGRRIPPYYIVR